MRSWKTPALLATMAVSGLGSLFAQGPILPVVSEPAPASAAPEAVTPIPAAEAPVPGSNYAEVVAPSPIPEPNGPPAAAPSYEAAPVASGAPASGGTLEVHSAPVAGSENQTTVNAPPAESVVLPSAPAAQPACDCQGNGAGYGGPAYGAPGMGPGYGGYGPVPPAGPIYTYGSGSGVAAGVLTPISNSGGLHTRYPYYNYRAPWYYQGPPSLNVTIIW